MKLNLARVLDLLCKGKQLEQNVTHVGVFYFIRDDENKLQEMHHNTFYSMKNRGFIEVVRRRGESPSYTGRPLNMSNYYEITEEGKRYHKDRFTSQLFLIITSLLNAHRVSIAGSRERQVR